MDKKQLQQLLEEYSKSATGKPITLEAKNAAMEIWDFLEDSLSVMDRDLLANFVVTPTSYGGVGMGFSGAGFEIDIYIQPRGGVEYSYTANAESDDCRTVYNEGSNVIEVCVVFLAAMDEHPESAYVST